MKNTIATISLIFFLPLSLSAENKKLFAKPASLQPVGKATDVAEIELYRQKLEGKIVYLRATVSKKWPIKNWGSHFDVFVSTEDVGQLVAVNFKSHALPFFNSQRTGVIGFYGVVRNRNNGFSIDAIGNDAKIKVALPASRVTAYVWNLKRKLLKPVPLGGPGTPSKLKGASGLK